MKKGFDYLFEKTDELPPELASIVLEFNYTVGFSTLASKYKLHLDQAEVLEDLTFRVMFGELSPDEYTSKLSSQLNLPTGTAKELVVDANTNIVEPVKKALRTYIEEEAEAYKDIELDESAVVADTEEEQAAAPIQSPHDFHPSKYQESLESEAQKPKINLTHDDVLHGIENPHPSIKPHVQTGSVKPVSGSKSYSDIMGGNIHVKSEPAPEPKSLKEVLAENTVVEASKVVPEIKPVVKTEVAPQPKPAPKPAIDLIALKGSSVVVTTPSKAATVPELAPKILPAEPTKPTIDPYKESI